MENLKVKDIIKICDAKLIYGNLEEELGDFKKDTREVTFGDTYVGIQGERVNRKYIL